MVNLYGLFLVVNSLMILFSVDGQQQLECVCEDGSQTEINHNFQGRSEVHEHVSSPVERDSVQFGHNHAGKINNYIFSWSMLWNY